MSTERQRRYEYCTNYDDEPPGDADCHTSDIGHWFAMTGRFEVVRVYI